MNITQIKCEVESLGLNATDTANMMSLHIAKRISDTFTLPENIVSLTPAQAWAQGPAIQARVLAGDVNEQYCIDMSEVVKLAFSFWSARVTLAVRPERVSFCEMTGFKTLGNMLSPRYKETLLATTSRNVAPDGSADTDEV